MIEYKDHVIEYKDHVVPAHLVLALGRSNRNTDVSFTTCL